MIHNTMRLTKAPEEIATRPRKSWDAIFDAYGFDTFHPIEARGVLKITLGIGRYDAERILQTLLDRGCATAP